LRVHKLIKMIFLNKIMKLSCERYERIVKSLVKNSFPILHSKKICIETKPLSKKFSACATNYPFSGLKIWINPKYCEKYNDFELKGLLAHELIHLEDFSIMGWGKKFLWDFRYLFSRKNRRKIERETDKKTILKGYGKELRALRLKRESIKDKNFKKIKRFYLSSKEIEKYLK